jgi:hypothetical protein
MSDALSFVACPNHDTNVGFNKLRFVSPLEIKCDLCGKVFSFEEIRKEVEKDYMFRLRDLQLFYSQNIHQLAMMSKEKEGGQNA